MNRNFAIWRLWSHQTADEFAVLPVFLVRTTSPTLRIIFTGFVNYEDMPAIYAMSDICVLPSIWDDPAPLAVIESLVSGKPLITTRSGGIPEYADEQSAIILERGDQLVDQLADAMTKIARDSDERDAMGAHKTALRSEFNKETYMAQLAIHLR